MSYEAAETGNYRLDVEYYGADFPVDMLVKRIEEGDFIIPGFQREYIWKETEASRFIESLLLGLPTPALFLAKDKFSNKYLVIDGQQRLKTLQFFYRGEFPDGKVFKLKNVAPDFAGLTYHTLSPSDRRSLDNSIIHCIIISDNYDPTGMFHLFERLNTTGTPLTPQEVRNAIYHGPFNELLQELSKDETWRELYGKPGNRSEEQELILRFFALYFDFDSYRSNMVDFLNQFMLKNKDLEVIPKAEMKEIFLSTIHFLRTCIGSQVFFHKKVFNKSLFDSIMLFTSKELKSGLDCESFKKFYASLINDGFFWSMAQHSTTSRKNLVMRLEYLRDLYRKTHP
jgi:uncharacterized protein with ParB-like and HNH nuclease domain